MARNLGSAAFSTQPDTAAAGRPHLWAQQRGSGVHPWRCRPRRTAQSVPHAITGVSRAQDGPAVQMDPNKVSLVQLGCPKNTVEGEVMLGDLQRAGFEVTEDHEAADCIVVNTCAFVEAAKSESLEAIMEAASLKQDSIGKRIVVTGCLAQRYSVELAEQLPEVDLMVGFQNYGQLPSLLRAALRGSPASAAQRGNVQVGEATVPFRSEQERKRLTPQHTAYLRVAEGCNHSCTFCAIPGFRGKFRSKQWDAVLEEAAHLVSTGVKELNLIAEDTNQYGMDKREDGRGLAELLRELSKLDDLKWLRILYAYPSYFNDELIDEIATNPKVCKYIDIPLQHISNLTLLGMNRPPKAHTVSLLRKLRSRIPNLALRTTFIAGFPGETEANHRELVDFATKEFQFERMGCFVYSEEDGTPAASLPDQVDIDLRQKRRDELVSLQQDISAAFAESLVGQQIDVLVDGYNEDGEVVGRTQWDAPDVDPIVFIGLPTSASVQAVKPGQLRRCLVTGASLTDLEAYPIS